MNNYWLLKSEPHVFSWSDLCAAPQKCTPWEGVRNYQARNFLKDGIQEGDFCFFYHSSCPKPGIVGLVRALGPPYPDKTQWDSSSPYCDRRLKPGDVRWYARTFQAVLELPHYMGLQALRQQVNLEGMLLLKQGQRLSIMPVSAAHWHAVLKLQPEKFYDDYANQWPSESD